jgi:hypothetical protein
VQGPQEPSDIQLPPDAVARDLTAALPPCHEVDAMDASSAAIFTLELEARDSAGLVVVGARVASRGGASDGLVECVTKALVGRRLAVGSFSPGERFLARYEVKPPSPRVTPPSQVAEPPRERPSIPQTVTRQQLRRRGGSR